MLIRIDDMTCGGCAKTIAKAVSAVDRGASLEFDVPRRLLRVTASSAQPQELMKAITIAGYEPVEVADAPVSTSAGAGGCCCSPKASRSDTTAAT